MAHFKIPSVLVDRNQFLLQICKGRNVLHLGCADFPYMENNLATGAWLHSKISNVALSCVGVDIDNDSVSRLREKYGIDNVVQGNAEHLEKIDLGKFDVILAGELIQQLNNPGLFLASARGLLAPRGVLVITASNAFCFRRLIRIPFAVESVHPHHTYYFSHQTLTTLVVRHGYVLNEAYAYRITTKKPILPYVVERLATIVSPNLGEGMVHVYTTRH